MVDSLVFRCVSTADSEGFILEYLQLVNGPSRIRDGISKL